MPKSGNTDRTEGYKKPKGENTSESGPTISASHIIKKSKTQRKNAKANSKIQEIKYLFKNNDDDKPKGMFANMGILSLFPSKMKKEYPQIPIMQRV